MDRVAAERLRILTLANVPLDEALGSGYVALQYAAGLRARGHRVDTLGPADYEPFPRQHRAIRYRQAVGMAAASLARLARTAGGGEAGYDVLEFYGGEAWLALAMLSRLPGRRFLLVSHSNGLETHAAEVQRAAAGCAAGGDGPAPVRGARRSWWQLDLGALVATGFRDCDALVTVAAYDRNYALRHGYAAPERVLAIDNPLPESYLGQPLDLARPPVIGYCGSWLPRKGVAQMARGLPPLLRAFPAWRLVMVGVGDSFRAGEHFPADVLPRITVVPQARRETELRRLYQGLAIAIQPSLYESFGLAAAEAMACGCALVATPVGFAAALRHGEEAWLLADASPHTLTAGLAALIEDAELRRRIACGGHRRVQSLRWDAAVATLEAAYLGWLGELRAGGGVP